MTPVEPRAPLVLESQYLRMTISAERGWFDLLESRTGTRWGHDPFDHSPGEVALRRRSDGRTVRFDLGEAVRIEVHRTGEREVQLTFAGLTGDTGSPVDVTVRTAIVLAADEPTLRVEVRDVTLREDEFQFLWLHYPRRQFSLRTEVDDGYLVVPYWQGSIVPVGKFKTMPDKPFWAWDDAAYSEGSVGELEVWGYHGVTMPWFGAVKGPSAYFAHFESDMDAAVHYVLNYNLLHEYVPRGQLSPHPRIAVLSPVWRGQQGAFGPPRVLTYTFMPGAGYVEMAKRYRGIAMRTGLFRSLREKIAENPNVARLLGAPIVNMDALYPWYVDREEGAFTWDDVATIAADLHDELGLERALFVIWGGFSKLPPESLPFSTKPGTLGELRSAVERAQALGYLACFYHGYPSLLEHSTSWDPNKAWRNVDGQMSGRWGRLCSAFYEGYARANLGETARLSGQLADYQDILTCAGLVECYDPRHSQTRAQDRRNKTAVLQHVRDLGLVCGSESARGWAVPFMDYAKGGLMGGSRAPANLTLFHVPLFNMVYHDALVTYDNATTQFDDKMLENLAYGNQPFFAFQKSLYSGSREHFRRVNQICQPFGIATALDELVSHAYLTDAYNVQRTDFSSGAAAIINLGREAFQPLPCQADLVPLPSVPARGFLLRLPDGQIQIGQIETAIRTTTVPRG